MTEMTYSKGKAIAVGSEVRAARAPNHALIRILEVLIFQTAFSSLLEPRSTEQKSTLEMSE
jgi:hypothetical protein